jgi:hypothetical protein
MRDSNAQVPEGYPEPGDTPAPKSIVHPPLEVAGPIASVDGVVTYANPHGLPVDGDTSIAGETGTGDGVHTPEPTEGATAAAGDGVHNVEGGPIKAVDTAAVKHDGVIETLEAEVKHVAEGLAHLIHPDAP